MDFLPRHMVVLLRLIVLPCIAALATAMVAVPIASADLRSYVKAEDQAYRWEYLAGIEPHEGLTMHELRLISQVWQGVLWEHRLRVITPKAAQEHPALALLIIAGMDPTDQAMRDGLLMAHHLGSPVAVLYDVPNQPLFDGLVEDDLLAHTFAKFLTTRDTTWPLLLPMVKGVVRAMDATQAFMLDRLRRPIAGFVVTGASKRGWTAWLTPVVDERVKAIAPQVYDNLNLAAQLQRQHESWGDVSGEIGQYTARGLPQRLLAGEQAAVDLATMVDPFSYRHQLTVPKLIILGTNDRYWPLDALNLYYDALRGERHVLYIANAGHNLQPGRERAMAGLLAFFQKIAGQRQFPTLRWQIETAGDMLTLSVTSDQRPRAVRAWVATAPTRDFREATWEAFEMQKDHHGYVYRRAKRPGHITAIFGEIEFEEAPAAFSLSTTVSLVP